ncbi:unnamed protein product [Schistosoma curassoni]|uniref:Uncharacterized protein n=1 Tax=Schistosoma curassoni TaxID=6186 RepID=A0A183JYF6_9TREM|nr:unnamed protein product [Schistosoma curassoni]
MEDVKTRSGADIASDHHLIVVVKMKLKLKKHWTTGEIALQRSNTNKLNELKIALNNWISMETLNRIQKRKNKKTVTNNSRTRTEKSKV